MCKEALFSIIGNEIIDSVFLDLFAGSGAIGIEAISRGAPKAYFVDKNQECTKIIVKNLEKAKFNEQSEVYNQDYIAFLESNKDLVFDIIYIDPPYNKGLGQDAITKISSYNLLKINGLLIYETDSVELCPETINNFERFKIRKYGRNVLNFYRRKE